MKQNAVNAFLALTMIASIVFCSWAYLSRPVGIEITPKSIVIPSEYRRKLVLQNKDLQHDHFDGSTLYREAYNSGWQDYLDAFVANSPWRGRTTAWEFDCNEPYADMEAPWIIGAPDEINNARKDGWLASKQSLAISLKQYSESDLRTMVRAKFARESN